MNVKTYAEYIPTCRVCGSTNVTITLDYTGGTVGTLPCGHPAEMVMIRNPELPPLSAKP